MRITIFAATGGIGRHLLDQAIATGHDVTAVVRNPKKLDGQVRTVTAEIETPIWQLPIPRLWCPLWRELMRCSPDLDLGRVRTQG